MKLIKLILILTLLFVPLTSSYAQKVTRDELKRYAIALDSIETLKNALTTSVMKMAKGNKNISAQRYALLMPIAQDAAKLSEAKATKEEISYVKRAVEIQHHETAKFQKAYTLLISGYVGDSTFGKVRSALATDTVLKKSYDSLMVTLKH